MVSRVPDEHGMFSYLLYQYSRMATLEEPVRTVTREQCENSGAHYMLYGLVDVERKERPGARPAGRAGFAETRAARLTRRARPPSPQPCWTTG